jgi:sialate O-acetylesterase
LPAFITELRTSWSRTDLPVYIGQLSSPTANWPDEKEGYAPLREVQRAIALADPHSGFVVTLDHGERGNVHPKNKQPVGERFARLALSRVYGETGYAAQSPSAATATLTSTHVAIAFRDLPGRLELRDPALPTLELLTAGTWKPASATLSPDAKSLFVALPASSSSSAASSPKAVRYAYRNFCTLTLFSDEGLPVSPWTMPVE